MFDFNNNCLVFSDAKFRQRILNTIEVLKAAEKQIKLDKMTRSLDFQSDEDDIADQIDNYVSK